MRLRLAVFSSVLAVLASSVALLPSIETASADVVALAPHSDRRVATGWIPWWNLEEGLTSVESHPKLFSDASVFWYRATAAGEILASNVDTPAESELITAIGRLHAVGVRALPTVNDFGMDSVSMGHLLADPARRKNLINNLLDMVNRVGADGVDLDFEAMNSPASPWRTTVRKKFPVFVAGLVQALHKQDLSLSLTVPARVSDNDPNWTVYDYRALSGLPDRVTVMTYDYHYAGGEPGPLAPIDWVNQVAHYAHARFARTPVFMGQPAYGLNWYIKRERGTCPAMDPPITATAAPTVEQAQTLAQDWGAKIQWDPVSGESHFQYHRRYRESGDTCVALREVWFEGPRSVSGKLDVVRKQHVQGVALWSLGIEDSHIWPMLTKFAKQQIPAPARSSIDAPSKVHAGHSFQVTGRFTVEGQPIVAHQVVVQRRVPGQSWKSITNVPTTSTGEVDYLGTATRTYDWRLQLTAGWDWRTTLTRTVRVAVRGDVINNTPAVPL